MVQKIGYSIKMMMRGEINKMGRNRNFNYNGNYNGNEVVEEATNDTPVAETAPVETVVDEPKKENEPKIEEEPKKVEVAPVKAVEPKIEKKAEPVKRTATL